MKTAIKRIVVLFLSLVMVLSVSGIVLLAQDQTPEETLPSMCTVCGLARGECTCEKCTVCQNCVADCITYQVCQRCEVCHALLADCLCERCSACHLLRADCTCEKCTSCQQSLADCTCEWCTVCGKLIADCQCERCQTCHKLTEECICEKSTLCAICGKDPCECPTNSILRTPGTDMTEVYVSVSTGNDTTGTGLSDAPLATLGEAVNAVASGGTIHLVDGSFSESSLTLSKSVTLAGTGSVELTESTITGALTIATTGGVTIHKSTVSGQIKLAVSTSATIDLSRNYGGVVSLVMDGGAFTGGGKLVNTPYYNSSNLLVYPSLSEIPSEILELSPSGDLSGYEEEITAAVNTVRGITDKSTLTSSANQKILEKLLPLHKKLNNLGSVTITNNNSRWVKDPSVLGAELSANAGEGMEIVFSRLTSDVVIPSDYRESGLEFEVDLKINGSDKEPDAPLTVSIDLPSSVSTSRLKVLDFHGGRRDPDVITPSRSGDRITFTLPYTGPIVVVNAKSGGSSGGSSSNNSTEKEIDRLWQKTVRSIKNASSGDTVRVSSKITNYMPTTVLDALKGKDVTLKVAFKKGTVEIYGKDIGTIPRNQAYYSYAQLKELFGEGGSSSDSDSASKPSNPTTGGTWYNPPAVVYPSVPSQPSGTTDGSAGTTVPSLDNQPTAPSLPEIEQKEEEVEIIPGTPASQIRPLSSPIVILVIVLSCAVGAGIITYVICRGKREA